MAKSIVEWRQDHRRRACLPHCHPYVQRSLQSDNNARWRVLTAGHIAASMYVLKHPTPAGTRGTPKTEQSDAGDGEEGAALGSIHPRSGGIRSERPRARWAVAGPADQRRKPAAAIDPVDQRQCCSLRRRSLSVNPPGGRQAPSWATGVLSPAAPLRRRHRLDRSFGRKTPTAAQAVVGVLSFNAGAVPDSFPGVLFADMGAPARTPESPIPALGRRRCRRLCSSRRTRSRTIGASGSVSSRSP